MSSDRSTDSRGDFSYITSNMIEGGSRVSDRAVTLSPDFIDI